MSTLHIVALGDCRIVAAPGGEIGVSHRKVMALLAFLALEAGQAHSRATLLGLLWPELPEQDARNNLRVALARLRAHLDEAKLAISPLVATRNDIRFQLGDGVTLDVAAFQALLAESETCAHASRSACPTCQERLAQAVSLYRGHLLHGLFLDACPAFDEWLFMRRERLHLQVMELLEELAQGLERSGGFAAALAHTRRQLELDPLHDSAHHRLLRLLAYQGQPNAALSQYQLVTALLRDELGVEPDAELAELAQQIRDNTLIRPTQRHTESAARHPHNLPETLTPFFGREAELMELSERLAAPVYRLLSLTGPGGIGKTRLAIAAAQANLHRYADGAFFVPLAAVARVEDIASAIADALNLPRKDSAQPLAQQLIDYLVAKQILLVIDNLEHLIDGVERLLDLLRRCPRVVLLVTSRQQLDVQAEDVFELNGLPVPAPDQIEPAGQFAAVRLFCDRAHRLLRSFKLTPANSADVIAICRLVEGLPLALELAASWIREFDVAELAHAIGQNRDLLQTTMRDIAPQHRSIRAVFDTSWGHLSAAERQAHMKLAIFRGGFTLDAAHTIADAAPALVSGLRNKSLLRHAGARRYDMHTLVQQFSAEALEAEPQAAAHVRQAHSHYFLTLLAEQAINLDTRNARTAADQIQPDWENISMAWQQASAQQAHQLLQNALDGLVRFCNLRGLFQEAQTLLEYAVAQFETAAHALQRQHGGAHRAEATQQLQLYCRLLTALAYFAGRRGLDRTMALAQQALALAEMIDSRVEIIANLIIQANAHELAADFVQGRALAERALAVAEAAGLELQVAICLDRLGAIALLSGDFARANALFQQVLAFHERTGRLEQRGREAIGRLGIVATEQGRYELALQHTQRYLASCERTDDRRNIGHAQHDLAFESLRLGDFAQTIALEEQSIVWSRAIGDRELTSLSLHNKAHAHRALGQLPEALACATEAVALARAIDARLARAYALAQLAETQMEVARHEHEWAAAAANFQAAAASFRAFGKLAMAYEAEIGLAELARRQGALAAALAQVAPILPDLPRIAADGWDEPIRAYVVCVQILWAVHDPAAETILDQGIQLLDALAQNIGDQRLRWRFLHSIAAHRELHALRAAVLDASPMV
jgi:predicted ATPase/DNA-binding SARP family transcriptional activator